MRPNQQSNKNRQRGRNNNGGRKHLNPLSRNYESNGPDVKVRGNAAHVAEKYLQLARDAQSSGDSVMAENYLQHAEHYFRIVTAAQQQMAPRPDLAGQPAAPEEDDDDFPPINDRFSSPEPVNRNPQPQPSPPQAGRPAEGAESGESAPATESVASAAEGEEQPGSDAEGPRRRERRRRRRAGSTGEGGAELTDAPQPDVELPAFLTAGSTTAAE